MDLQGFAPAAIFGTHDDGSLGGQKSRIQRNMFMAWVDRASGVHARTLLPSAQLAAEPRVAARFGQLEANARATRNSASSCRQCLSSRGARPAVLRLASPKQTHQWASLQRRVRPNGYHDRAPNQLGDRHAGQVTDSLTRLPSVAIVYPMTVPRRLRGGTT